MKTIKYKIQTTNEYLIPDSFVKYVKQTGFSQIPIAQLYEGYKHKPKWVTKQILTKWLRAIAIDQGLELQFVRTGGVRCYKFIYP